jgi:hypothetical protein
MYVCMYVRTYVRMYEYIVTCCLLTRRIISGLRIFISIYWIYIRQRLQSLITLPIATDELANSSGSSSAPSWRKPLLWIFRDELLVMNSCGELLYRTPNPDSYDELLDETARASSFHRLL